MASRVKRSAVQLKTVFPPAPFASCLFLEEN